MSWMKKDYKWMRKMKKRKFKDQRKMKKKMTFQITNRLMEEKMMWDFMDSKQTKKTWNPTKIREILKKINNLKNKKGI